MKRVELLSPEDFKEFPIWEFVSGGGILGGESIVVAVVDRNANIQSNQIIGTQLVLNNGAKYFGILGNVDLLRPIVTEHFLTVSLFKDRSWFHLARYHDIDYNRRGPDQLAAFLGLDIDRVFPIKFQIDYVAGLPNVDEIIYKKPPARLSEADLIQLAVDSC